MSILESIDWHFLSSFFGEHGKLIAAIIAFFVAVISLAVAIYRHQHARTLERILGRSASQVRRDEQFVKKAKDALEIAADRLKQQEADLKTRELKLNEIRTAFRGKEHDLWCMHPPRKPVNYDAGMRGRRKNPVIMVANLKGGVGKTTLTANLAAHFSAQGLRVLLIDVDYQGSLSNMMLMADGVEDVPFGTSTVLGSAEGPETENALVPFT